MEIEIPFLTNSHLSTPVRFAGEAMRSRECAWRMGSKKLGFLVCESSASQAELSLQHLAISLGALRQRLRLPSIRMVRSCFFLHSAPLRRPLRRVHNNPRNLSRSVRVGMVGKIEAPLSWRVSFVVLNSSQHCRLYQLSAFSFREIDPENHEGLARAKRRTQTAQPIHPHLSPRTLPYAGVRSAVLT